MFLFHGLQFQRHPAVLCRPRLWNPEFPITRTLHCTEYFAGQARVTKIFQKQGWWTHSHDIKDHRAMDWNGRGFLFRPEC